MWARAVEWFPFKFPISHSINWSFLKEQRSCTFTSSCDIAYLTQLSRILIPIHWTIVPRSVADYVNKHLAIDVYIVAVDTIVELLVPIYRQVRDKNHNQGSTCACRKTPVARKSILDTINLISIHTHRIKNDRNMNNNYYRWCNMAYCKNQLFNCLIWIIARTFEFYCILC